MIDDTPTITPSQQITPSPATDLTPTSTPGSTPELLTSVYSHPQGIFELLIPSSWSSSQSESGVIFNDSRSEGVVQVIVENTGSALDNDSFSTLIDAREKNIFSVLDDYLELERLTDESMGYVNIQKQFSQTGEQKFVSTIYRQYGNVVLIIDLWVNDHDFETNQKLLDTILESVDIDRELVSTIKPYSAEKEIDLENDYYTISFPPYWTRKQTIGDISVVDTITSPDGKAIIQTIVYDDGEYLPRSVAAKLVLTLLREQYTRDINITSYDYLPDRRERLTWESEQGDYQGITIYEVQDNALLMIVVMWENELGGDYLGILDDILNTYRLDAAADE